MADVFISYSRRDKAFVQRLHEALKARGREAWVDWEGIPPTAEWMQEIRSAIDSAQAFLFVISPQSASSEVCRQEIEHAVAQNKRLVPLVCVDTEPRAVPDALARLNWVFFRPADDFDAAVETLQQALDTDLDWVRTHTRLLVRAREWEARERDRSRTLRGSELQTAEQWLISAAGKEPAPTPLQTEFIVVSRKAAARRARITLAAVGTALVVAVGLAGLAYWQWQSASSRELAATAEAQMPGDPELSVLLASEALTVHRTQQAEEALRRAVFANLARAILSGHAGWVVDASFAPDGRSIVTASSDRTARLWDAESGELRAELQGHLNNLVQASFSPNGSLAVTVAHDNTARVWDATTGKPVSTFHGHRSQVNRAAFSLDGQRVVTASNEGLAWVWDARTAKRLSLLRGHGGFVLSAAFSPDGQRIVTTSSDGEARVWDATVANPDSLFALKGHTGAVSGAAFSPDGTLIVTHGSDQTARVWNAADGKLVAELRGHGDYVATARFDAEGKRVLTAGSDGSARLWEAATGSPLAQMRGHALRVSSAFFSPDEKFVVTASEDNTARVWETATGAEVARLLGHRRPVRVARFSPDGRTIVTASEDLTVRLWNAPLAVPPLAAGDQPLRLAGAEMNGAGLVIVAGTFDTAPSLWDPAAKTTVATLERPVGRVDHARFNRDGTLVVSTDREETCVWDARSGRRVAVVKTPARVGVDDVDLSPDKRLLAVAGDLGVTYLFEMNGPTLAAELDSKGGGLRSVQFSPDGRLLVTGGARNAAYVWDVSSRSLVHTLKGHSNAVAWVRFSPDGGTIATASWDETVRLWDTASGRPLAELRGHSKPLWTVRFNSAGNLLVSASADGSARIWEVASRRTLGEIRVGGAEVVDAAFGSDRQTIVTLANDVAGHTLARLHSCPACADLEALRAYVSRTVKRSPTVEAQQRHLAK